MIDNVRRGICAAILLVAASSTGFAQAPAKPAPLTDKDIVEAYHYMLGRWLVLRQEALDLKEGFKWNEVIHREPGGVAWANPNLDVVYSEAWIVVDPTSCTLVELPAIKGRYYTVQVLNGWGEVTANINERHYPRHPSGKFGLCLRGANVALPPGTQRIDLPNRKSRILMRIELGANPAEAVALQKQITMKATGSPKIDDAVVKPDFANDRLPGAEGLEKTEEILTSDPDINKGTLEARRKARRVARAIADPAQRARIDDVIRKQAIPAFMARVHKPGPVKNGWARPRNIGNYGGDYLGRSVANLVGIWANNPGEAVYFGAAGLDGSSTYLLVFPKEALPTRTSRYFWSVIAVDGEAYKVIPNALDRYLLNKQSKLSYNGDGSLTLVFGPRQPVGAPDANRLPTPEGKKYNLTFRFYGPSKDIVDGAYYPPPLIKKP
jgi:hypothetical protein